MQHPISGPEYENAAGIFRNYQFGDLQGSLLTVIEGIGLPERQEEAIKCQVKKEIWKLWGNTCAMIPRSADIPIFDLIRKTIEEDKATTPNPGSPR